MKRKRSIREMDRDTRLSIKDGLLSSAMLVSVNQDVTAQFLLPPRHPIQHSHRAILVSVYVSC